MAALLDKSDKFNVREVTILSQLIDAHHCSKPIAQATTTTAEIDQDRFTLALKQARYDCDVFDVWQDKHKVADTSIYHKQREWRVKYEEDTKKAARAYLKQVAKFLIWDDADSLIQQITTHKRDLAEQMNLSKDSLVNIPFVNLCSSCSLKTEVLSAQANITSWLLTENESSIGILTLPVFTYRKQSVWRARSSVMEMFSKGPVSMDTDFQILYKDQNDARDERPMTYPGVLIFPGHVEPRKSAWKQSALLRTRRTPEILQPVSNQMLYIEDVSAEALPFTTDVDSCVVQGAAKFEQLGVQTNEALLLGVIEGCDIPNRHAFLVVDMRVRVANMLMAVLTKRCSLTTSLHYIGICEDMVEYEWAEDHVTKELMRRLSSKELTLPGVEIGPKEMPHDLVICFVRHY